MYAPGSSLHQRIVFCQKILRSSFCFIVDSGTVAILQSKLLGVISQLTIACLKTYWKVIYFLFIQTHNFGPVQIAEEIKTQPQYWRIVLKFKASSVSSSFFMTLFCVVVSECQKESRSVAVVLARSSAGSWRTTLLSSHPGRATGIISRNIRENFLESGQL